MILLVTSCKVGETNDNETVNSDTIPPEIRLYGNMIDTAYLNTFYIDNGAYAINEFRDVKVKVSGTINTAKEGVCYLDYDAEDAAGNKATTITRTVQVVQSNAAFLNGSYSVACSCTAQSVGSAIPKISANNYTASVLLSQTNKQFELIQLNIGVDYVIPFASLNGNNINLGFYRNSDCLSSGTLSPTKSTFTIETVAENDSRTIKYKCKNVYTKTLIIN